MTNFVITIISKENQVLSFKRYKKFTKLISFIKKFYADTSNQDSTLFLFICDSKRLVTRTYKFDKNLNKILYQTVLHEEQMN